MKKQPLSASTINTNKRVNAQNDTIENTIPNLDTGYRKMTGHLNINNKYRLTCLN